MKISGIYKITNPDGEVYIGNSVNIKSRWSDYRCLHNCDEQPKLYASFLKHGVLNHLFEIIEECGKPFSLEREQYFVDLYDSLNNGLNSKHGGIGRPLPEGIRKKIAASNTGKKMSEDSKAKMSAVRKGKEPWNKNKKGVQVAWNKGIPWDEKNKERLRTMAIGRKDSEETRKKKSLSNMGRITTEETRKKLSAALKGRTFTPETKEKMRQSRINFVNKNKK